MAIKINGVTVIDDSQNGNLTGLLQVAGNISGGNVSGTNVTGTLTTAAQPNVTSVGTLTSLAVTGNVTSGNISGTNVTGTLTTAAQPNVTSVGTLSSLAVTGNVQAGNVSGTTGTFTSVGGTLSTAAQTNITSVGSLTSLTVLGNAAAGNISTSGSLLAGSGEFVGNLETGNVAGGTGTFTTVLGTLGTASQTNITELGSLNQLAVVGNTTTNILTANVGLFSGTGSFSGNVQTGNISGTTGTFTNIAGTLTTVAQPNITSVGTLTSLTVNGTATHVGNIDVTGNINVTGNLNYDNVTDLVVGDPLIYIGNDNAGNLYDLGMVVSWTDSIYQHGGWARDASDGVWKLFGNVVAEPTTTVDFANAIYQPMRAGAITATTGSFSGNVTTGNTSGTTATFTNLAGTLTTAAQPNVTSVGTLTSLSVTGNVSTGNVSGTTGTFTNVGGTLSTAAQPNITSVGTLTSVSVTGNVLSGNVNSNAAVRGATGVFTGNVSTGNVSGTTGTFTNVGGTLTTAAQTNITSVGTLTSLSVTGNVTTGNVSGTTVSGTTGTFTNVGGTLSTAAQPNITSVGTLTSLSVTGNVTTGNVSGTTGTFTNVSGSHTGNGAGLTDLNASNISSGTLAQARLANASFTINGTSVTLGGTSTITAAAGTLTGTALNSAVVTSSLTSVGALNSGSITSGFGAIDIGTDTVTCGGVINANGNGVGNIGSATTYFNTVFAKATSAQYADLAEMYEADGHIEPGTVVCFGGTKEVTICEVDGSRRIAGVVSTNPSYLMNSGQTGDHVVAVALQGRVPVKVTGRIRKGDMMVAASDGRARAEENPAVGSVIGKALADFDGADGVIEVVIGRI